MKKILLTIASAALLLASATAATTRSNKSEVARNMQIFNSIFKELQTQYVDTIDATRSMRTAIDAMLGQIDPYTEYYPADEQDQLLSISSGQYSGVGSTIQRRGKHVIFSEPQWGSPSREAGIRHGDRILCIDGDTIGPDMDISDVSKKLRGQAGTHVRVDVVRPYAEDSLLSFDITRGSIKVNPVPYYGVLPDSVGYIRLTTFNEKTASQVRDAVASILRAPGLRGIVLDLRGNGGGLLESAVQVVSNFVDKGTEVVRTRGRDAHAEKVYKTTQSPQARNTPLVVLTDGGTASSSEIVAGSLQDLDRAAIVGERSYGKGLVQTSRPTPYGGYVKITTGRYYIPSGRLIQAIDYSHRNPDGTVARIPDSLTTVYHTRAGREVRDGGGITPDIKSEYPEGNRLVYNIVRDNWSFDFANRYAARHESIPSPEEFEITDTIFNEFKAFIDPAKFNYDRTCELILEQLEKATKTEGYLNDQVQAQLDSLKVSLKHDLNHDLDQNRKTISEYLASEILQRYYFDRGSIIEALKHDAELDSAAAVLNSPERYKAILSGK